MSIKISSRKAKGRKLQQLIALKISQLLGIPVGKDLDIESRSMGLSGTDVILRGDALKLFPFSVETKSCESWSIPQWIVQAKSNQKEGTDWLLFCKKSREDPIVIMDAEVFFKLYKKLMTL